MVTDAQKDDPLFRRCLRSTCHGGQVHESGDAAPLMTCMFCEYKMCFTHQREWHAGQTCKEFDEAADRVTGDARRAKEDAASAAHIQTSTKTCPGPGCAAPIEKNDGCDHMTCSRCRYEFCWECRAEYGRIRKQGNTGHAKTCRYHSANLPGLAMLNPRAYFPT